MNLKQIAQKLGGYIQSKTQDDEGWVRQNKFTPSKQVQQMGQNLSAWGNIANQGIKNQIDIQKRDFNQYTWQPLKENPVLAPTLNRFEQATPAIGNQLKQLNPFAQKQTPQQNWQDTKKIGAAALTAYGLVKAPLSAVLGGAAISPLIKLGTNVYENKKGADLNKKLSQYGQSRTDVPLFAQQTPYQNKPITQGVGEAIFEGAGQGLANAGTTRLTNSLVGYFSSSVPFLNKLTEKAISSGSPVATDTIKEATQKFFNTAGKRLIKAAVVETAVESPIWATFTQSEQETYLEALQREAIQNLQMNVGMAGVQSLGDARSLIPIVKNSVDTAVNNYFKNISSPENLKRQAGYIDFMGNVVDGTDRTNRFNNLVDTYYKPNATVEEKYNAFAEIRRLAGDIFSKEKIAKLNIGNNRDPENLIMALSDVLNKDIPNNTGYQEPFTIRNFLANKELQRGGMDLTDKTKGFPQTPDQPIKTGGDDLLSEAKKYRSAEEFVKAQQQKVTNPDNGLSFGELAKKYKLSPNEIQKAENWSGLNNTEKKVIMDKIDQLSLKNYQQNNPNAGILSETYTTKNLTDIYNQSNLSPESVSKVEGKPLTLYHGTDTPFEKFDLTKQSEGNLGKGIYLTDSDYAAKIYGKETVRNKQLAKGDLYGKTKDGVVLSVDISPNAKIKKIDYQPTYSEAQKIREQGFDGITYPDQTLQNTMGMSSTKAKTNATVIFNENVVKINKNLLPESGKLKTEIEKIDRTIENIKKNRIGDDEAQELSYLMEKRRVLTGEQTTDLQFPSNKELLSPESKGIKQPTIKIKADSDQNLLNNQQGRLDMVEQKASYLQDNKQSQPQTTQTKIKIKAGQTNQTSSGNLPQGIIPQTKLSDIENKVYGTETKLGNTSNKQSVGFIGSKLRNAEIKANEVVSKGLTSQNKVVRGVATLFQDLFGGAGKSQEQLSQKSQFRGGTDYATKIAGDTQNYVYNLLNNDTKSLERVHSVLDPEISKIKVDEASLTANEKEALKMVREVSDFINDTNHRLGFISDELWQKNRGGKYLARAYETFDYPPEVADFIKNKSLKFDINPFKKRTEMTDWKKENAITDPAYLIGKRLQQTLFNSEVKKYTDWAMKSGLISDTQKAGYVQLSDSKAYGEAAGKWIRKDALEDIKGFFVSNDIGQKAYDILNWYDRNPLRRGQKMLKTVFNPAVRLGNRTGNYVFAWLNGINPVTFAKNRSWAKNAINSNDPIYRYAIQNGITGSDITKADITRISAELKRGVNDINTLQKINAWAKESYGRVDDVSKVAAFKTWLDRGVSPQEALNRTRRGFQDYNMVGMLYDLGAKIPILGNPFVRFASESIRITKNAAVDHPFRLAATLGAWKLFTDVMSRMSGEDEEDRKTRESRVGASHLPFTNISTNVQTPYGEINASRLLGFSSTFTPEDTGKLGSLGTDISKYAPFQNPLDARNYTNDPIIGPVISLATDKDFRGKSIADPKQNKYTGSLLTPGEQNLNRLGYAARSYLPPSFTDLYNIGASIQGKENVYGQVKTPLQSILRTYPGIKIEQFGPKEAEATRQRNADYNAYELDYIQKQINAVKKQQAEGKITPQQAQKRIDSLNREKITSQSDGERTFETSPEAPKDIMERISLATKATVTNPTNALKVIQAIFTEEKMRKLSGDTLIFERETNLNKTKEKGDAVDHIIPLSLGGDNSDKNKRYISAEANQEKAKLETSLARKLANGEITGSEARKQIKNYMEKYSDDYTLNTSTKSADKSTEETIGKIYTITNEETGKDTEIDLTFPEYPELTGLTEADKALKSTYYSALSKIKTNAGKLYKAGKITAQEYNDILVKIKSSKSKSGSGSGKKAKKITFKTTSPKALPKITLKISSPVSRVKLKSAPKIKLSKTDNRKYTIKA